MAHVPALDGIRAVAVVGVLAFHGGVSWASGGFLGVDAFFVLSGYLITTLLLAEWARTGGRIDLTAFWGRRARRLLPALLLVVAAVAVGARALLPPEEVRLLRGDGIAALFYVANWRMVLRGGDYFAQTAAPSPLEHTWSLGIEEQFYLLWPLVLCAVLVGCRTPRTSAGSSDGGRVRARLWALVVLCGVGAVASAVALAAVWSPADPGRAYYGTDTRGGAILVGAALAAFLAVRGERGAALRERPFTSVAPRPAARGWRRTALGALAALATAVVVGASTRLSGTDPALYRGGMAAVALAVAVVIAHVVLVPSGWSARLLSLPPLPALGRISYGVYLWHWPVFVAANADRTGLDGLTLLAVRCLLTVGIAAVSYVLVERPVQRGLHPRRPVLGVAEAGVALAAGAVVLLATTTVPSLPVQQADASVALDRFLRGEDGGDDGGDGRTSEDGDRDRTRDRTKAGSERPTPRPTPELHRRRPGQPVVVDVFGDSVAWTLVNYLPAHPELDVRDRTLMGCGISRTAPFRYFGRHYAGLMPTCRDWPRIWRSHVARDDPDVALVLVGRWETMDRVLEGRWTHVGDPAFDAHLRSELDLAIRTVGARGAHVLLATEPYNRRGEQLDGSLFPEDEPHRVTAWNDLLRSVASDHPHVRVVDLGARISPGGRFTWTAGGYQVRSDGLHLTPSGVQGWIAPWLLPQLVAAVPR
ncbi:acyltransferase family protein [Nocardioides sp. zg-1308]|uniref:acyltransferase family protein n=1 Tax=Nocardioides sp. zg-1308 TaxID=2736253 RepID=UPI0015528F4B|nr:acyltransferase family protein [Nocardioides sp. zg-1308]NPD06468.1 acyltransferase family protein [Nocardioides sp. zg-1308]